MIPHISIRFQTIPYVSICTMQSKYPSPPQLLISKHGPSVRKPLHPLWPRYLQRHPFNSWPVFGACSRWTPALQRRNNSWKSSHSSMPRWGPLAISWFISPIDYKVIYTINHTDWSYKPTLLTMGPHPVWITDSMVVCARTKRPVSNSRNHRLPPENEHVCIIPKRWKCISRMV